MVFFTKAVGHDCGIAGVFDWCGGHVMERSNSCQRDEMIEDCNMLGVVGVGAIRQSLMKMKVRR